MNDTKINGYVTLKSVVANVKNDIDDYKPKDFNRLMQMAIRGVKQLNIHSSLGYQARWLTLSAVKTVSFPSDYVKYLAIGIPYAGKVWTFTKEQGIVDPLSESEGVKTINSSNGEDKDIRVPGYVEGYGVPGGRNDIYYKIDINNELIIVNGYSGTKVLFIYKSTGVSLNGETRIPALAEEAVIAWVHWKRKQHATGFNQYDKDSAERDFGRAYDAMISSQMPTLDDLYDAIYSANYQTPKR